MNLGGRCAGETTDTFGSSCRWHTGTGRHIAVIRFASIQFDRGCLCHARSPQMLAFFTLILRGESPFRQLPMGFASRALPGNA